MRASSPNTSIVEILCHNDDVLENARVALDAHAVRADRVRLHVVPTDRVWLRDSAPIGVIDRAGEVVWLDWAFNAWAKYPNWQQDAQVGPAIARLTGLRSETPRRQDTGEPIVLEGGGIDVNGQGLLLVTEEWLLSDVQVRNPGLTRADYEQIFAEWLGIRRTIWLGEGCVGDDTHGHVDDIARFVAADDDRARGRGRSGGREPRALDGQPAAARAARERPATPARCAS